MNLYCFGDDHCVNVIAAIAVVMMIRFLITVSLPIYEYVLHPKP